MSMYKLAVDRIRNHEGYLSPQAFEAMFLHDAQPETMAGFIKANGCLITSRHDLNPKYAGRDFLVNLMTDLVVLHVSTKGEYSLHEWEKSGPCSQANQLRQSKQNYLLSLLLEPCAP